jgi:hypothetical protein
VVEAVEFIQVIGLMSLLVVVLIARPVMVAKEREWLLALWPAQSVVEAVEFILVIGLTSLLAVVLIARLVALAVV